MNPDTVALLPPTVLHDACRGESVPVSDTVGVAENVLSINSACPIPNRVNGAEEVNVLPLRSNSAVTST